MKKISYILLATCLSMGIYGCNKNETDTGSYGGYLEGGFWNCFEFIILDKDGNNICMQEDFNIDEFTLEFEGKIFKPNNLELQKIDDSTTVEASYVNAIRFSESFVTLESDYYPITWVIHGYTPKEETSHYIIRYKDNEWNVDFTSWEAEEFGKVGPTEAIINGAKAEKVFAYLYEDHPDYADESEREKWLYPLYVE